MWTSDPLGDVLSQNYKVCTEVAVYVQTADLLHASPIDCRMV